MARTKLLVYLLRRDLRVADNPILHHLASVSDHGFTHLLPIYVFPAQQVEISGFLKNGATSPYPPALSRVGKFWRCGPHRAKFLAESVWNLKTTYEELGSGMLIRVGSTKDVVEHLIGEMKDTATSVNSVWMTEELSGEEKEEQEAMASLCSKRDIDFKIWKDEKYLVDDRDTGLAGPEDLPDVFTTYRKAQEPLREKPREVLPRPKKSSLPALPTQSTIPDQAHPFVSASSLDDLCDRLAKPLVNILANPPPAPKVINSSHSFVGGESEAWKRVIHLAKSGAMTSYKDTRNGMVGPDYSTKLAGYLSLGCITARQVHEELLKLEDGKGDEYKNARGYGEGENEGTKGVRFELLWRDYMRLCTAKFGHKLFRLSGFRHDESYQKTWNTPNEEAAAIDQDPPPAAVSEILERFKNGTTGMGLVDASQRELYLTGYTSNRARQNVASFLAKHLEIDWRYGAEWYEMLLVDYDVSSNWANWQYVSGVGNDPRGDARTFNPVKQAFDYDKSGTFVRSWIPELKDIHRLDNLFQIPSSRLNSTRIASRVQVSGDTADRMAKLVAITSEVALGGVVAATRNITAILPKFRATDRPRIARPMEVGQAMVDNLEEVKGTASTVGTGGHQDPEAGIWADNQVAGQHNRKRMLCRSISDKVSRVRGRLRHSE
ncbi:related to deoxyribodipyrimidine photo-lyase [Claviceps purpurea 20.1]|uniref:Cryptochrome DASH n=1 Tax=Claviceps purpurea (strain 20.1) TaxID=1111077 RepID=M1W9Y5_CLAP2|nr:hypothetical protein E4U38_008362 [Claviceps purpurea]KAG6150130.1 hypothetical protein E4U37_006393 [Claviceps purpurea]KAG6182582.1 hypothetical protein E4U27_001709 [Claviceps purpurea]KAG6236108.1 hypothetical protein E4U25_004092 [Claviceps purpurea]CCE32740.1 related to deoxyribodipyrimidine photo-lyase [Claviceps purpurea 20.1]